MAIQKTCPICKGEFQAKRKEVVNCSKICTAEAKRRKLSKPKLPKPIKQKTCLYCQGSRESGSSFCTKECGRAWDNRRKTKAWREQPEQELSCANCGGTFKHKDPRKNSCSAKCAYSLRAKVNQEKYGTENPSSIRMMQKMKCTTYQEFQEKYPDYHKMYARVYASNRRSKESRYQAIKLLDTKDIFDNFKNRCFSCKSVENLELDHHIPLIGGGELTLDNCVILCRSCNARKHAKTPEEVYTPLQILQIDALIKGKPLIRVYTPKELHSEYLTFLECDKGYAAVPFQNRITVMFNPHFYEVENLLWQDLDIQEKLIANRMKYREKHVLNSNALLRGFKVSGLYRG